MHGIARRCEGRHGEWFNVGQLGVGRQSRTSLVQRGECTSNTRRACAGGVLRG